MKCSFCVPRVRPNTAPLLAGGVFVVSSWFESRFPWLGYLRATAEAAWPKVSVPRAWPPNWIDAVW